MDRRTLLKATAAMTAAPVAMLTTTAAAMAAPEHPETRVRRQMRDLAQSLDHYKDGQHYALVHPLSGKGGSWVGHNFDLGDQGKTQVRVTYDAYLNAYNTLYPEIDDDSDYSDFSYSPEQGEYSIARLNFWTCPCRSMAEVAEKVKLVEESVDLSDDLQGGGTIGCTRDGRGYGAMDLFMASLRGETVDLTDDIADLREFYAEMYPIEVEENRLKRAHAREEAEEKERKKLEKANRVPHPEQIRLEHQFKAALKAWTDWLEANPDIVAA